MRVTGFTLKLEDGLTGRLTAICPFHEEKTGSLSIDVGKGVFHCFGCGVSGKIEGVDIDILEENL